MPSPEAIAYILERRKNKKQNTIGVSYINQYDIDNKEDEVVDIFSNSLLQQEINRGPQEPNNLNILQSIGQSLYKSGAAFGYELTESAAFGAPGLVEAGLYDAGIQTTVREFQEDDPFAKVAGGVGSGIGYLIGLPVKAPLRFGAKFISPSIIRGFGKRSVKSSQEISSKIGKEAGLDKKIINDFSNKFATETSQFASKNLKADKLFRESFEKNINTYIAREMKFGRMTSDQAKIIRKMKDAAIKKGVPIQNLQQLAKVKYGDTFTARVLPELLNDATVFAISDFLMESSIQTQRILRDEQKEYDWGQALKASAYGFLAGTAINVTTAALPSLGYSRFSKMSESRKDFADGVKAYLGANTYKNKSLRYLSKQLAQMADVNKMNGRSTRLEFGDNYIDFNKFNLVNRDLAHKNIERELTREFGDDAKDKAIKWLMSEKRKYAKDLRKEAIEEGWQNYKNIWLKMAVGGLSMGGVSAVQAHVEGQELQVEDFISSFIIGSFTQRRGNVGKIDIGPRIKKIRESLEALGVDVQNTSSFSPTFARGNETFGVGISRDNPELTTYLKEQRIISDTDESITNDKLLPDDVPFLDYESIPGNAIDPTNGKFEMIHGILKEDFKYVKTLDQLTLKQANEIENIFNKQGLKTTEDFRKAIDERVDKATKGIEQSIVSVLEDLNRAGLDDLNIVSTKRGITIPKDFKTTPQLLKNARNGDYKEWLGKEGIEAEQEILDMFSSLEMAVEISHGLGNAKIHKQSVNTIVSPESLKSVYNIVRDSEQSINTSIENFDGRKEFRFTDVESYIVPMIRNKGNNVTKKVMEIFSPERADDKLNSLLTDVGILHNGKIIDDYSKVGNKSGKKSIELEKVHNIIKTLGKYDITTELSTRQIEDERISDLKNYLDKSLGLDIENFNKPNLRFMYQMVLNDINRIRLNNKVTSAADVNFIVKFSSKEMFSQPGLISDKGIRGFSFIRLNIPSNQSLATRYNEILTRLKEDTDGLVNIIDDPRIIKRDDTINELESVLDSIYSKTNKFEENVKLKELFDAMNNSPLDPVKNRMKEYLTQFDEQAHINILSMLKRQGVIKKDVNGNLQLINENITLEKFENLNEFIIAKGVNDSFIEEQINKRREIDRKYIGDASDVKKNPSINLDQFFNKYNIRSEVLGQNFETNIEYVSFKNEDIKVKQSKFDTEIFDADRNITDESIMSFTKQISLGNKEFKKFTLREKREAIQDITQIVFGSKDKDFVQKLKIENGKVLFDDKKEVIQKNPVHKYFNNLGIDYSFFDNNVLIKEYGRSNVPNERVYNILQTESVPDELKIKIKQIRVQVAQDLAGAGFGKEGTFSNKFDGSDRSDGDLIVDENGIQKNDIGIVKLDIFDGMDSIVINSKDVRKIVEDFNRFYDEHSNKIENKAIINNLKKSFDETTDENFYDDYKVELASRFLILEAGYKSKDNELFYNIINSSEPEFVDKYTKRIKLYSTKSFVRPTEKYLKSLLNARKLLGKSDNASKLIEDRLKNKKGFNIVVWDDDTENMSKIIKNTVDEYEAEYPDLKNLTLENNIGGAHGKVSGFDSISYISKRAMMEFHTYMGHDSKSMNPIKPVISSQGEGKTLLYGKTLFTYDPSLEGFFKLNPDVDILVTKSGAKAYDGDDNTIIKEKEWDELGNYKITNKNDLIRKVDIDAIGFRPEKDAKLLSASEGVGDYNYMDISEHSRAFNEIEGELNDNLDYMAEILSDPYKLNSFMKQKMIEGNIPEDSNEGSLQHLSTMMFYLKQKDFADPIDYSLNQVQKYLAKEYIDNIFTTRRSITNRIQGEVPTESFRYGGQAPLIQSVKSHLGKGKKTRLLPTLFKNSGDLSEMIIRGQIMLPHEERKTNISQLSQSGKNIRIVQNKRVLNVKEFLDDFKDSITKEDEKYIESAEEYLTTNATLETAHDFIQSISEMTGTRYELGVISRRNPRTRPDDITLLGLKGFLSKEQGLAVEINSFDIVNTYEGDYDADKVDYFFAHSDFMFDYINRNQAFHVQGIDPSDAQSPSNFTFQLDSKASHKSMLQKIGTSVGYKRGIGIVQKTPRKINYLQNLANDNYLFDATKREKWDLNIKQNKMTNDFDGPGIMYKSGDNEFVTVDTRTLAYYQRSAYETQYILDGANKLNPNISSNIYEWSDNYLFPDNRNSISPREARSSDLKEILQNGQTATGKRVRIFEKYKLEDGKYKATEDLNEADKLVIREFLNQQNKLLTAFGDQSYTDGVPRKSSFYDLQIGAKGFRDFHKNLYDSLKRQLFHKRKILQKDDDIYLDELLKKENGRFKPIDKKSRDIYDGKGGGYLDRIAVTIAKKDLMEDRKQYNLDTNVYLKIEEWFDSLVSSPSKYVDSKIEDSSDLDLPPIDTDNLDELTTAIVNDTKNFNKSIASIKRLSYKKEIIRKSNYGLKWKKNKIQSFDYVIKKLKEKFYTQYKKDISKINPRDLKYKDYVLIDDSNLKRSVIHANTMSAMLRHSPGGFKYDSWTESLTKKQREDLDAIKQFNKETYGSNTLLDDIIPFGRKSILTSKKMIDYVAQHSSGIANVFELRQKYLLDKIEKHGIKFLYAYMEPTRNRDAIGVFNNRPISIPYKESKRYSHGIQLLAGIASGKKLVGNEVSRQKSARLASEYSLDVMLDANEYYRKFFNKDVSLRSRSDMQMDRMGIMPFDKNMQRRIKNNLDFNWLSESLPSNEFSTINKSVIGMYKDYIDLLPNKTSKEYYDFVNKLNDIEEYSYRKDYMNPLKHIEKRLSLDEDFVKISQQKIYDVEGDDGLPENLKNNKMYNHFEFIQFEPTLRKKPKKLINMLKNITDMESSLINGVREMPFKDSGREKTLKIREALNCN